LSPQSVVLSICVNLFVLVATLVTSLYIGAESEQLTDLVLNVVALEFLLLLDDNCIDRNKCLLQIKLIAQSAAKQLVYEGVASTTQPEILRQLSRDPRSIEVKNRRKTYDAILKAAKSGNNVVVTESTPGLQMINFYCRAITSPVTIDMFSTWPTEYAHTAYAICYEVFLKSVFIATMKNASSVTSSVAATASSAARRVSMIVSKEDLSKALAGIDTTQPLTSSEKPNNEESKPENKEKTLSQRFKESCQFLFWFSMSSVFFSSYLLSELFRALILFVFLPIKSPVILAVLGCYITAYAAKCI